MNNRGRGGKLALVGVAGCVLLAIVGPALVRAQSSSTDDWEKAAGGKMSFEVASVKRSSGPVGPETPIFSNFVLGYGDNRPPEGLLTATNVPLFDYIAFAYKLDLTQTRTLAEQMSRTEFFSVEARPEGTNLTRDQVRLMMQALLAERFKLAVHFETKKGPAYALVLAKPGKLGPQMRAYPDGFPCSEAPAASGRGGIAGISSTVADGQLPASCGRIRQIPSLDAGFMHPAGRNISMETIVNWINLSGDLDRPLVDRTGLSGTFDVSLEFARPPARESEAAPGSSGTTFLEAVNDQLGLKLQSITAPVRSLVIDHIEEPSPN